MGQKVPGPPWERQPPTPPPLKFHKISVPGKYTTSNSLVDPKIRRDSYPDLLDIRKEEK